MPPSPVSAQGGWLPQLLPGQGEATGAVTPPAAGLVRVSPYQAIAAFADEADVAALKAPSWKLPLHSCAAMPWSRTQGTA